MSDLLQSILAEVAAERKRQDRMWGEQNHPLMLPGELPSDYDIGSPKVMREIVRLNGHGKKLTYLNIFMEELAEFAYAASMDGQDEAREELIQCAAVLVAMVERIDRNDSLTEVKK